MPVMGTQLPMLSVMLSVHLSGCENCLVPRAPFKLSHLCYGAAGSMGCKEMSLLSNSLHWPNVIRVQKYEPLGTVSLQSQCLPLLEGSLLRTLTWSLFLSQSLSKHRMNSSYFRSPRLIILCSSSGCC